MRFLNQLKVPNFYLQNCFDFKYGTPPILSLDFCLGIFPWTFLSFNLSHKHRKNTEKIKEFKTCGIHFEANSPTHPFTIKPLLPQRIHGRVRNRRTICRLFLQTTISPKTRKKSISLFANSKIWWRTADKAFVASIF